MGPYLRYENEPYVEHVPQKPLKSSNGLAAMFTVAMPTARPAFVNSVIWVGRTVPRGFESRSYQPHPGRSPKSLPKPARLVDSARSAEAPMKSGRPCSALAYEFTQAPQLPRAARLGCLSPGCFHRSAG